MPSVEMTVATGNYNLWQPEKLHAVTVRSAITGIQHIQEHGLKDLRTQRRDTLERSPDADAGARL